MTDRKICVISGNQGRFMDWLRANNKSPDSYRRVDSFALLWKLDKSDTVIILPEARRIMGEATWIRTERILTERGVEPLRPTRKEKE